VAIVKMKMPDGLMYQPPSLGRPWRMLRAANGRERRNCLEPNVRGLMRNLIDHQANWMRKLRVPFFDHAGSISG
jgi:hypothetical protein